MVDTLERGCGDFFVQGIPTTLSISPGPSIKTWLTPLGLTSWSAHISTVALAHARGFSDSSFVRHLARRSITCAARCAEHTRQLTRPVLGHDRSSLGGGLPYRATRSRRPKELHLGKFEILLARTRFCDSDSDSDVCPEPFDNDLEALTDWVDAAPSAQGVASLLPEARRQNKRTPELR